MNDAIRTPEGAILSLARDWYVAEGFPSLALQMEVDALDWREHILFELELHRLGHYDCELYGAQAVCDGDVPVDKTWTAPDWVFPFVMGAAAVGAIALLAGWGNA